MNNLSYAKKLESFDLEKYPLVQVEIYVQEKYVNTNEFKNLVNFFIKNNLFLKCFVNRYKGFQPRFDFYGFGLTKGVDSDIKITTQFIKDLGFIIDSIVEKVPSDKCYIAMCIFNEEGDSFL